MITADYTEWPKIHAIHQYYFENDGKMGFKYRVVMDHYIETDTDMIRLDFFAGDKKYSIKEGWIFRNGLIFHPRKKAIFDKTYELLDKVMANPEKYVYGVA